MKKKLLSDFLESSKNGWNSSIAVPYAIRSSDKKIVSISSIVKLGLHGLSCGCECPDCGEALVAKISNKVTFTSHFSHKAGSLCKSTGMTILHRLAQEILFQSRKVYLPKVYYCGRGCLGRFCKRSYHIDVSEGHIMEFDDAEIPRSMGSSQLAPLSMSGISRIPDVLLKKGSKLLAVEIGVSSFCDDEKIKALRDVELPVIEINLSNIIRNIPELDLQAILHGELNGSKPLHKWLVNSRLDNAKQKSTALYAQYQDFLKDEAAEHELAEIDRLKRVQELEENRRKYEFCMSIDSSIFHRFAHLDDAFDAANRIFQMREQNKKNRRAQETKELELRQKRREDDRKKTFCEAHGVTVTGGDEQLAEAFAKACKAEVELKRVARAKADEQKMIELSRAKYGLNSR